MQCACCYRGKGGVRGGRRGSPGSRVPLLVLGRRTPQLLKRRRAHARDVLSTAYRHPELPPGGVTRWSIEDQIEGGKSGSKRQKSSPE